MAIRVTQEEVRALVETDTTVSLAPFIRMANRLTDRVNAADTDGDLSSDELKDIEGLLAAHFYEALRDKQYTSKSQGGASGSFQGSYAMRLESTDPGQAAMMLDVTGTLAQLSKTKARVGAHWLGRPPSEQTDYVDRD